MNDSVDNVTEDWHEYVTLALTEVPYSSQVIFSVALFFIFVASLVGNVLTCIVIYYDKTMHTVTNCYLFNLAVSDLLVTFPILIIIYQLLTQKHELFQYNNGVFSCNFVMCIHFLIIGVLWNNSILVMTALSIERYIAVCYPMTLKRTGVWQRVGKILGIIWTIAVLETVPEFWMLEIFNSGNTLICFSLPSWFGRVVIAVSAVLTFIVPLAIMIFVYSRIAVRVNHNNVGHFDGAVFNSGFKKKKVNKLILTLTLSFIICWLPCFLLKALMFAVHYKKFAHLHQWWSTVNKIAMFNSWLPTVLNPLLFSAMSTKFRKSFKRLCERKLRKRNLRSEKCEASSSEREKSTKYYQVE
ncbi:neuromedin-U receptor 2-like [Spodoptera frugiperda]|uniref:Neuromedin-U receptor 2-like n=2 Tax=Spodoptera frugiperda TaxID=7108 RepID=A0A9R0CYS5_SPOFR|nr:neuromedin-U receptor 2-like [Spodoptera frugiperda]